MEKKLLGLLLVTGVLALAVSFVLSSGTKQPAKKVQTTTASDTAVEVQAVGTTDSTTAITQDLDNVQIENVDPLFTTIDADLQKL
ncbi:hypothetical protein COV04_00475 [Candidatus Uhrbacteria bacterium CG10_big_fil_rev_8_21_14_0_10_48_11]|uniref:Uncharacterized protein n=1 Tax=Candidatus Uhrbacteria bacterium CG10_big_fil_rev_8_21_14_0_10_48_11 TaxID=1975037 RepID=A0A2M8LFM2_9BACT|nr:MAG: hypothetical protein COV04_00475 [Candidatus Uhrbacteria bacterium CG10_big_fil_rev_8_21_14_0_10_48_11]